MTIPNEVGLPLLALYYLIVSFWPYLLGSLVALIVAWVWCGRKK